MGTCKPEQDGQVFAAQQMANELGVGIQFETGYDELYDKKNTDKEKRRRALTVKGANARAAAHVIPEDLTALDIKVLFFTFHTQIPVSAAGRGKKKLPRETVTAQQPYVHAKLMVEDDVFFTLGSLPFPAAAAPKNSPNAVNGPNQRYQITSRYHSIRRVQNIYMLRGKEKRALHGRIHFVGQNFQYFWGGRFTFHGILRAEVKAGLFPDKIL